MKLTSVKTSNILFLFICEHLVSILYWLQSISCIFLSVPPKHQNVIFNCWGFNSDIMKKER